DSPVSLPAKEEAWTYEKSSGESDFIHTATEYEYDGWGNCIKITQNFGDGQKLFADITYDNTNAADYIIGLPVDIRVYDSNGNLLRHRSGDYDDLGQLKELSQYWANNESCRSINKLTYDNYGNIQTVSDSRGAALSYKYDDVENMFVKEITQRGNDTESYTSFIEYDEATQTKKSETDCNGNSLRYAYDGWQRIKEIRTAYDTGTTPAVSYEYSAPAKNIDGKMNLWYAITNNKVTYNADDGSVIQTVLQVDGLGRAVRTAKTGFVNGVDGWNASGAVEYDSKGRTVKEGMTEFIKGTLEDLLNETPKMTELYTSYEYDEKDRQIKTILPDGSIQFAEFEIKDGKSVSYSTDPLGNVSVQETDSRGNIVRVAKNDKDGKQLTQVTYKYNEMGEMLKAFDAKGHPITAEYDLLGRRTALESLDSGRQEFFYDECSNLVRENNSVLRENNKQIVYEYDGLNRLVRIDYPDTEDTLYVYGGASDARGAAGKILKVTDASGSLEYEYGRLGEVTKETRTINTHLNGINDTESAVMEYRSDYLGRMQWIVYPDGEKIVYGYDKGGQVTSVTGEHYGHSFEYVTNILYDQYGQRIRIDYGNGTFTEYSYDPARRWLDTIKTENKWGKTYQNISYSFDRVGNVLGYENDCL
ncbi:MAG: RHS repeat protein, partial [Treponema sp.]|nr:RHS repeat protein [Treponema sp.]